MVDFYMGTIVPWAVRYAPENFQGCRGQTLPFSQYNALYSLIGTTFGGDGRTTIGLPNLVNRVMLGSTTLGGSSVVAGPNAATGGTGGFFQPQMNVTSSGSFTLQLGQIPGHTHPATFTATSASVPVTVSAPSANMNVTIPVAATAPSSAIPTTLSGTVYLANTAGPPASKGPFQSTVGSGATLTGTATGSPGGTFTGNVTTVTGGNVTVAAQSPFPATSVNITTAGATTVVAGSPSGNIGIPLPPYLAIGFMIAVQGIYPVNPN